MYMFDQIIYSSITDQFNHSYHKMQQKLHTKIINKFHPCKVLSLYIYAVMPNILYNKAQHLFSTVDHKWHIKQQGTSKLPLINIIN